MRPYPLYPLAPNGVFFSIQGEGHLRGFQAFGKRLHVGRVNSPAALGWLQELGVGSCDGTGWLRGDPVQLQGLVRFLEGAGNLRLFEAEEWVDVGGVA